MSISSEHLHTASRYWTAPGIAAHRRQDSVQDRHISCDVRCVCVQLVFKHPSFVPYFREATPETELANLNIGSRPTRRKPVRILASEPHSMPMIVNGIIVYNNAANGRFRFIVVFCLNRECPAQTAQSRSLVSTHFSM